MAFSEPGESALGAYQLDRKCGKKATDHGQRADINESSSSNSKGIKYHADAEYADVGFHDAPVVGGDVVPGCVLGFGVVEDLLDAEDGND